LLLQEVVLSDRLFPCGHLTYRANRQVGLNQVDIDSGLWPFLRTWLRKLTSDGAGSADKQFERFIFLWVSVNAWASMAVPDQSKNHEDAYLVHSMAADPTLNSTFTELLENPHFYAEVSAFAALGPVFQTLWLRNNNVSPWDKSQIDARQDYVDQVFKEDPFHRKTTGRQSDVHPAFAPACARTHRLAGEQIPVDWPHLLSMIYQVRCNLFHGGKTYRGSTDHLFVDHAFKILWRVWRQMLPPQERDQVGLIAWKRLFIRSGIRCRLTHEKLDLSAESNRNRAFVSRVLDVVGWGHRLCGSTFFTPTQLIEEREWLDAWESLRIGSEAGPTGFEGIELEIMDTHISGVVRWLNGLGYRTAGISCEGHGNGECFIELADRSDEIKVARLISSHSNGIHFEGRALFKTDRNGRKRNPTPQELLNLGESLYRLVSSPLGC